MAIKNRGERSLLFPSAPGLISAGALVSANEGKGPLGQYFDQVIQDDTLGEDSFEKAECRMFQTAVRLALDFMRTFPCGKAEYCWLSYEPENETAKKLYASFGFEETGEMAGDEIVAVLKL